MTKKYQDRCPGCEMLLREMSSFPALSRYRHGDLCSDCGRREAFEADFIGERIAAHVAELRIRRTARHIASSHSPRRAFIRTGYIPASPSYGERLRSLERTEEEAQR